MVASRADLLALSGKRRFGTIDLPICGLTVRYRSLSESELAEHEMETLISGEDGLTKDLEQVQNARARLIVRCLVDDSGNPLLNRADIESVNQMDSEDTALLYDTLREFVGLARKVRSAKQQSDAKKNSNSTNGDVSPTS